MRTVKEVAEELKTKVIPFEDNEYYGGDFTEKELEAIVFISDRINKYDKRCSQIVKLRLWGIVENMGALCEMFEHIHEARGYSRKIFEKKNPIKS